MPQVQGTRRIVLEQLEQLLLADPQLQIIGQGSWLRPVGSAAQAAGKGPISRAYADPLLGGTSDHDLRLVMKGKDQAIAYRWQAAQDKLRNGIQSLFPKNASAQAIEETLIKYGFQPAEAKALAKQGGQALVGKILQSVNLYAPPQLMRNVVDEKTAAALFKKARLGAQPGRTHHRGRVGRRHDGGNPGIRRRRPAVLELGQGRGARRVRRSGAPGRRAGALHPGGRRQPVRAMGGEGARSAARKRPGTAGEISEAAQIDPGIGGEERQPVRHRAGRHLRPARRADRAGRAGRRRRRRSAARGARGAHAGLGTGRTGAQPGQHRPADPDGDPRFESAKPLGQGRRMVSHHLGNGGQLGDVRTHPARRVRRLFDLAGGRHLGRARHGNGAAPGRRRGDHARLARAGRGGAAGQLHDRHRQGSGLRHVGAQPGLGQLPRRHFLGAGLRGHRAQGAQHPSACHRPGLGGRGAPGGGKPGDAHHHAVRFRHAGDQAGQMAGAGEPDAAHRHRRMAARAQTHPDPVHRPRAGPG